MGTLVPEFALPHKWTNSRLLRNKRAQVSRFGLMLSPAKAKLNPIGSFA